MKKNGLFKVILIVIGVLLLVSGVLGILGYFVPVLEGKFSNVEVKEPTEIEIKGEINNLILSEKAEIKRNRAGSIVLGPDVFRSFSKDMMTLSQCENEAGYTKPFSKQNKVGWKHIIVFIKPYF